jgi:hypothetical protein
MKIRGHPRGRKARQTQWVHAFDAMSARRTVRPAASAGRAGADAIRARLV